MARVVFARLVFFFSLNIVVRMVVHLLSIGLPVPAEELRPGDKIDDGLADEIQNTGVVETDGQKQIEARDGRDEEGAPIDIEDRSQHSQQTTDGDVLELPQPERRSSFQVVGINIDDGSPPIEKGPQHFSVGALRVFLF